MLQCSNLIDFYGQLCRNMRHCGIKALVVGRQLHMIGDPSLHDEVESLQLGSRACTLLYWSENKPAGVSQASKARLHNECCQMACRCLQSGAKLNRYDEEQIKISLVHSALLNLFPHARKPLFRWRRIKSSIPTPRR